MIDALQWMINLIITDLSRLTVGLIVLVSVIEVIFRVKDWLTK